MDIIFVSSVTGGGSGVSQRQLARRLGGLGHRVEILAASESSRFVRPFYERNVDLSTRFRTSSLRPALLSVQRPIGRRLRLVDSPDHPTWTAVVPENAYSVLRRRHRPDVVVASSIDRVSWRRLRAALRADGIPSVLYLREVAALGHLAITKAPPDLLLANAESLAQAARDLGFPCTVVPSVVEVAAARIESVRSRVLLVNPIELLGGDRVWPIAAARPDIDFVLQESGIMSAEERAEVMRRACEHPNVTVRPFASNPAEVYRDAKVLLVPHRVDNRPRVILEAQTNGIPVIASAFPGLEESVGAGGLIVTEVDRPGAWIDALASVWDQPARYAELCELARAHAQRPDVVPEQVAQRFESLMVDLVAAAAGSRPLDG